MPRVMVLYHGGEPLLLQRLPELIRRYKKAGVSKIKITTNASLLTPDVARALVTAGLDDLFVSFDGESPEENDAIRRRGQFSISSANILELLRIRKDLVAVTPQVRICNIRIATRALLNVYLSQGSAGFPEPPEYLRLTFAAWTDEISFMSHAAMAWPSMDTTGYVVYTAKTQPQVLYCQSAFETVTVMSNGNVVPCCYDIAGEEVFGNVLENTIFDIWQSPRAMALRDGIIKGYPVGICRRCTVLAPRYLIRKDG